jgi:hypothetical protein
MSMREKQETVKLRIVVSRWLTVTVDGVGRVIALAAISSLTFLAALYLYIMFFRA